MVLRSQTQQNDSTWYAVNVIICEHVVTGGLAVRLRSQHIICVYGYAGRQVAATGWFGKDATMDIC